MPFDFAPQNTDAVFSLEGLRDWLRGQPGKTRYKCASITDCLWCRFAGTTCFIVACERLVELDGYHDKIATPRPHTYAAALARCEALIAERAGRV